MVEAGASFMDKVEAAVEDGVAGDGVSGGGEEEHEEMQPVEPLAEPPDDGGPVGWPMPEFCPLTIDGALKESFMETIRKDDAERPPPPPQEEPEPEPEVLSPDSRPSSSKRHRAGTASPSSRSPYRNILQVFQQCRQDLVGEADTRNY